MYVYKLTEVNTYTVGFYEAEEWIPESDHATPEEAAERVRFLNGGAFIVQPSPLRASLLEYPGKIEAEALSLCDINDEIDRREHALGILTDAYWLEVTEAKDEASGKLKYPNEQSREIRLRERQRTSESWTEINDKLQKAKRIRVKILATLERLRGEFSIAKLERRAEIPAMEL